MSNTLNRVILIGNIGGNINHTETRGGAEVFNAQLATNDVWFDSTGHRRDEPQWHHLTAYSRLAGQMSRALAKGDMVCVEGRIHYKDRPSGGVYSEIVVEDFHRLKKASSSSDDHIYNERAPSSETDDDVE
jgi:single stranded DNA-binding protein